MARVPPASRCRALTLLVGLAFVGSANAEPETPVRLRTQSGEFLVWEAPGGCADAESVDARVKELLGESELDLKQVRRVHGRVTPEPPRWTLDLTLAGAFGQRQRQLRADNCGDLAEAAAVAITLAFEAARAGTESAVPDGAAPAPEPDLEAALIERSEQSRADPAPSAGSSRPVADESLPDATVPPTPTRGGGRLHVGAEFVVDVASMPVAALGATVLARLQWSELALGVYGVWLPGAERPLGPGQSVSFTLVGGGVRACHGVGEGLLDTRLCAGLEAGRLSADGVGLLGAQSVSDLWLTPHAGLELSAELSRALAVHVRADALVPFLRQGYAVNEIETVHRVAPIGVRAAAGVLVAF